MSPQSQLSEPMSEGHVAPVPEAAHLRADHDRFEKLTRDILATVVAGDRADVAEAITLLQDTIGAHLDGEEREILPRYAEHAPADAARILEEHAVIRRELADLDVTTDLHLIRADAIAALLESLHAHAARENTGLYAWLAASPLPAGP